MRKNEGRARVRLKGCIFIGVHEGTNEGRHTCDDFLLLGCLRERETAENRSNFITSWIEVSRSCFERRWPEPLQGSGPGCVKQTKAKWIV